MTQNHSKTLKNVTDCTERVRWRDKIPRKAGEERRKINDSSGLTDNREGVFVNVEECRGKYLRMVEDKKFRIVL